MDEIIERLKDAKTTVAGTVAGLIVLVKEFGYEITIPQDKLQTYALIALAVGLLLSGGKKK
jgi:glutamine amidotransferase PdxT